MWLLILTLAIWSSKIEGSQHLLATGQLPRYKMETMGYVYNLTDDNGAPVYEPDISEIDNALDNNYGLQSLMHVSTERIPVRPIHTKGSGAFGFFEVTKDISDICKAKVFSKVGKQTKVVVRFSHQAAEQGDADTLRQAKGFSVKFYTEEGNMDFVGLNFPIFDLKDSSYFSSLVHALNRNPQTRVRDTNSLWDFLTSRPETLLFGMFVFGDTGIPNGFRHIPGYPIHTYQIYNDEGHTSFVRFRFAPNAGVENLNSTEAVRLAGEDPDYFTRDLFEAILNGNYPSWTLSIQRMTKEDVARANFNPFDITLMWPEKQYPHTPIGKLVLNENVKNFFAEIEQLSFSPGNLCPGIRGGVDEIFEARRLMYPVSATHRLGSNFHKIKVNCPMSQVHTYYRDGMPPVRGNGGNAPAYFPNSFGGPKPSEDKNRPRLIKAYVDPSANNFWQSREIYENVLTEAERSRLIANLVSSLSGVIDDLKEKAINLFTIVHPNLGQRIRNGLKNATTTNSKPVPIKD